MGDKPSFTFKVGINKHHSQTPWEKIPANTFTIQGKKKKKILIDSISVSLVECFTFSHVMLIIGKVCLILSKNKRYVFHYHQEL